MEVTLSVLKQYEEKNIIQEAEFDHSEIYQTVFGIIRIIVYYNDDSCNWSWFPFLWSGLLS